MKYNHQLMPVLDIANLDELNYHQYHFPFIFFNSHSKLLQKLAILN